MPNDHGLDLDEIFEVVDTADVLIIRFHMPSDRRLLVDTRSTAVDPPIVRMVGRASSVEERFRSIKRLRPRLPLPERVLSFQWPRHIRSLAETGVWDRIVQRIAASGHQGAIGECEAMWRELVQAERGETIAAITGGEGWQTIWERKPAKP